MLPARVAMTSPSRGVNPIVGSTDRPPSVAHNDATGPRTEESMSRGRPALADGRRVTEPGVESERGADLIVVAHHRELQRARAGIHDEDVHALHFQSRTSGRSSPWVRVYSTCRARSSTMCWRTCAARAPS